MQIVMLRQFDPLPKGEVVVRKDSMVGLGELHLLWGL